MKIIKKLKEKWKNINYPFLIHPKGELHFQDLEKQEIVDLSEVISGMIHKKNIAIENYSIGDKIDCKIVNIDPKNNKVRLIPYE